MMPMGFEFGFCKRSHVVKTRQEDWEETDSELISVSVLCEDWEYEE